MSTETDVEMAGSASGLGDSLRAALDGLGENAGVERVYGEPIERDGKTVVPVARVGYGFGGGFGSGDDPEGGGGSGGGVGGAVSARPVGALEIDDDETRFVRFSNWKRLAVAAAAGVAIGVLLGRR